MLLIYKKGSRNQFNLRLVYATELNFNHIFSLNVCLFVFHSSSSSCFLSKHVSLHAFLAHFCFLRSSNSFLFCICKLNPLYNNAVKKTKKHKNLLDGCWYVASIWFIWKVGLTSIGHSAGFLTGTGRYYNHQIAKWTENICVGYIVLHSRYTSIICKTTRYFTMLN